MVLFKFLAVPGSLPFLAVNLAIGAALARWTRFRRIGRVWIAATCLLYIVLALPVVATAIIDPLPSADAVGRHDRLDLLVVFDGDNRRGRVATACRAAAGTATDVRVLGEPWMLDPLRLCGIAPDRLAIDEQVATTRDQMDWVARVRGERPASRIAVIASRLQMPRIRALAAARHLDVQLLAAPIDAEPPTTGWRRFVPSYIALRASRDAIYEHVALAYYRYRGWIATATWVPGVPRVPGFRGFRFEPEPRNARNLRNLR